MDSDDNFEVPFEATPATETSNEGRGSQSSEPEQYEDYDSVDEVDPASSASVEESIDVGDVSEIEAARAAFENDDLTSQAASSDTTVEASVSNDETVMDDETAVAAAASFVHSWNTLVSTTNWEKGRIIALWRAALIEAGTDPLAYSDAAWVRRVGGVTAPHVGRLRRVYERFVDTFESYDGLFWTHFLAALDWDDAAMWLEGAVQEKWSISKMRDARWRAMGAVDSKRPTASEIIEVDLDEDVIVPSGSDGDDPGKRQFDGDGPGATGPQYDDADFGDADELVSLAGSESADSPAGVVAGAEAKMVQPFRDLPDLPDDLSDAIETLKLAILRHKTGGWKDVQSETLDQYLKAIAMLLD